MIRSMTGFGSATFDNGIYKIGVEMKAVNNRYRDISIRMPSGLRASKARSPLGIRIDIATFPFVCQVDYVL